MSKSSQIETYGIEIHHPHSEPFRYEGIEQQHPLLFMVFLRGIYRKTRKLNDGWRNEGNLVDKDETTIEYLPEQLFDRAIEGDKLNDCVMNNNWRHAKNWFFTRC